jgi:flavodoxin
MEMRCLIIVHSYHHNNTLKVAEVFSKVLDAKVITTDQAVGEVLDNYDLLGFGAGIDSGRHYKPLLDLVEALETVKDKPAFIFSTSAIQGASKVYKDHSALREKLHAKGYAIIGEFSCKGFNTNSFLKYFGGMNKGKPDAGDLKDAENFALGLLK